MASISQIQSNIQRYKNLKVNINNVLSELTLSIESADDLNKEIKNKYQINDDSTPIVSRTKQLKSDLDTTCNYLRYKVLPAIDEAISSSNRQISAIEEEQRREEEQRKKEEEQRKKEEEQRKKEEEEKQKKEQSKDTRRYRYTR